MDLNALLDEAKRALGVESDYALAKALAIPEQRISDYRKSKRQPDTYAATRLALAIGRDPLQLIAEIEADGEKNAQRRGFWRDFLSSASRWAATLAAVSLSFMLPWPGGAASATAGHTADNLPRTMRRYV